MSLQPIVVPYAITVTNIAFLAHISGASNSSAGQTFSVGLYSITGGTTGTLSLASGNLM